jgi:fructoselysine-6-P-deglycase FrlB-like protein
MGKKLQYLSYKEIHFQYIEHQKTFNYIIKKQNEIRKFFSESEDIVFVACGSSYWMSLSAHKTMQLMSKRKCYAIIAGDLVLCPEEYRNIYQNPVFVFPSRSGTTSEILKAAEILKSLYTKGKIFSITEYQNSKLAMISDFALNTFWANEESVCQTRSFSNLYIAAVTIAAVVGNNEVFLQKIGKYLKKAPELYKMHEVFIKETVDPRLINSITCLGSGLQFGLITEGAYIVIEMAEFNTNYFQLLEYRHGPIVTADKNTLIFICSSDETEKDESKLAKEIREAGAKIFAVAPKKRKWADYTFCVGQKEIKEMVALHFVFVLQSFAHHFSIARGKNPDSPGKLVPFIVY